MFDLLNCLIKMFFKCFTFCITNPSQYSYLNDPNLSRGICLSKTSSCLVLLTLTCALPKPWSLHIIYNKKFFRRKLRTASDSCAGIWGSLGPLKESLVYVRHCFVTRHSYVQWTTRFIRTLIHLISLLFEHFTRSHFGIFDCF